MQNTLTFSTNEPSTTKEKANKYDEIVQGLWGIAVGDNPLHSILASQMIRILRLYGPNGENPDGV